MRSARHERQRRNCHWLLLLAATATAAAAAAAAVAAAARRGWPGPWAMAAVGFGVLVR